MAAFLPNGGRDLVYGFPVSSGSMANVQMSSPMAALAGVAQMALNAAHTEASQNHGDEAMMPKNEPPEVSSLDSDDSQV